MMSVYACPLSCYSIYSALNPMSLCLPHLLSINELFAGSSTSPAVRWILCLNVSVLLLQFSINFILRWISLVDSPLNILGFTHYHVCWILCMPVHTCYKIESKLYLLSFAIAQRERLRLPLALPLNCDRSRMSVRRRPLLQSRISDR